ncbi:hypothetical protein VNO77_20133 [Canavalia gladiata]|uniref:Uncharacterized protein n=1 Tax=Canavalia gladiata TaxID=3824 RepID=A0AAN9LSN3_CANGL
MAPSRSSCWFSQIGCNATPIVICKLTVGILVPHEDRNKGDKLLYELSHKTQSCSCSGTFLGLLHHELFMIRCKLDRTGCICGGEWECQTLSESVALIPKKSSKMAMVTFLASLHYEHIVVHSKDRGVRIRTDAMGINSVNGFCSCRKSEYHCKKMGLGVGIQDMAVKVLKPECINTDMLRRFAQVVELCDGDIKSYLIGSIGQDPFSE